MEKVLCHYRRHTVVHHSHQKGNKGKEIKYETVSFIFTYIIIIFDE